MLVTVNDLRDKILILTFAPERRDEFPETDIDIVYQVVYAIETMEHM